MSKKYTVRVLCAKRDMMFDEQIWAGPEPDHSDWAGFSIAEEQHNEDCEGALIGSCRAEADNFSEGWIEEETI